MNDVRAETSVVVLRQDGSIEGAVCNQREVASLLGGEITFCGGIEDLLCFAVCRKEGGGEVNTICSSPDHFDLPVRGDVVLVGSDEEGEAFDLSLEAVKEWFS